MCGIYGTTINYTEGQLRSKLKRTSFRGPDKMGLSFFKKDNNVISFGHNRLSIIDLDSRSNQPFTYNRHIHIVFNGEIYNFKILKQELIKKGHLFNTESDTEVICSAYLEYGEKCVNHLNGMFSFVIYDENNDKLFGARDRLGQKPFYYYHNGINFEFSSQLASIKMHNNNLSISEDSIGYYLTWGNIPDPYSIFNEIKKLKAGHSFIFNTKTGSFKTHCYWDIDYKGNNKFLGNYKEAKLELNDLLLDAVSSRLNADVPVGVFLSGGVDSSLITALASKKSKTRVKTFSVKFNESNFDESKYAKEVSSYLDTDHNVIECNYNDGIDLIENFNSFYDEPFADSSAIPSMLLAKHTSKFVKVALTGDGGDESFLGYQRYKSTAKISMLYDIPYNLRVLSSQILKNVPNYKIKMIAEGLKTKNINTAYLEILTGVNLNYIKSKKDYRNVFEKKYLDHSNKKLIERVSDFDIKTYLNWDINTKVDRATMAYSLEARSPLLDHRVVEFASSLPTNFKFSNGKQKRILKDVLYQYVPENIFDRPKSGFTMPFASWFRKDLKDFVLSELDDDSLKKIPHIDIENVKFMIKQHMDGTWNRYPLIWKLIVLKQWLNKEGKGFSIK